MLMLLISRAGMCNKETRKGAPEVLSFLSSMTLGCYHSIYYFTFWLDVKIFGKTTTSPQWPGAKTIAGIPFLGQECLGVLLKWQTAIGNNWIWHQAGSLRPPVTSSAMEIQSPSLWFLMIQENNSHKCHLLNHWVAEVLPAFHLIINSWEANVKEQIYEKRPGVFC